MQSTGFFTKGKRSTKTPEQIKQQHSQKVKEHQARVRPYSGMYAMQFIDALSRLIDLKGQNIIGKDQKALLVSLAEKPLTPCQIKLIEEVIGYGREEGSGCKGELSQAQSTDNVHD